MKKCKIQKYFNIQPNTLFVSQLCRKIDVLFSKNISYLMLCFEKNIFWSNTVRVKYFRISCILDASSYYRLSEIGQKKNTYQRN